MSLKKFNNFNKEVILNEDLEYSDYISQFILNIFNNIKSKIEEGDYEINWIEHLCSIKYTNVNGRLKNDNIFNY